MSLKRALLPVVPAHSHWLYRVCRSYVDFYNGENNDDMESNGELRFLRLNLPQCKVVFDIGANVGAWTDWALTINPGANIHCFEPSRVTFQRLLGNRFPPNVVCRNVGMSSSAGEAKLFVFADSAGINSLYRREGLESYGLSTQQKEETVALDTVDHYCETERIQSVDFAKVDVEGHELEVFKGMSSVLKQGRIKIIQFEYGGCNIDSRVLLKDIFEFFKGLDYTFYKIYPKEVRRVARFGQRLENFQYQNWAVVKNGHPLWT